jgi:hypothetical protein
MPLAGVWAAWNRQDGQIAVLAVVEIKKLIEDGRLDDSITGDKQDIMFDVKPLENFQSPLSGVGSPESFGLVDENSIVNRQADGFDDLSGQCANHYYVLSDSALVVRFQGLMDGG